MTCKIFRKSTNGDRLQGGGDDDGQQNRTGVPTEDSYPSANCDSYRITSSASAVSIE
ncbi:MAG: hypothetical protein LC650_00205 [Actinobacteria bacterium]|nr:hypothetical protein [Actinomycetota bacterium]